jgi:cytochrome d ubiquinol oxidase subunit II
MVTVDLPLVWVGLLAFIIIVYVILDGFDLGIGILFFYANSTLERDTMMNSIAPIWDGNETWLVMGGSCLYGVFPVAYSLLLPILYIPLLIMVAALIFRGVAFEFRFKAEKAKLLWDIAFSAGSTIAAFSQGIILGTFVQGYDKNSLASAVPYQWLTTFSLMSGVALVFGYALLGATWLIGKTTGELQEKMFKIAKILLPLILLFIGIVSVWTPLMDPFIWHRWFKLPNLYYLSPLPLLTLYIAILTWHHLNQHREKTPFYLVIFIFLLCYIGFGISAYPYIIPHSVTIWEAASNRSSLLFILVGTLILLPVLICYTLYSYHIFRGKISDETGYH